MSLKDRLNPAVWCLPVFSRSSHRDRMHFSLGSANVFSNGADREPDTAIRPWRAAAGSGYGGKETRGGGDGEADGRSERGRRGRADLQRRLQQRGHACCLSADGEAQAQAPHQTIGSCPYVANRMLPVSCVCYRWIVRAEAPLLSL